jgi:hypothetical protein
MTSDQNWFFSTLSQSAAAVTGIVGGFFVSRLLQQLMTAKESREQVLRDFLEGFVIYGAAIVKGNTMLLSNRYVCQPLAYAYRQAPIFTGHSRTALPFNSIDAVETVAHEWFHTRGVVSEEQTECHAVQYTWKWLRRGAFPASFLAAARRHLLDNSRRPPGYKIPAGCLLGG